MVGGQVARVLGEDGGKGRVRLPESVHGIGPAQGPHDHTMRVCDGGTEVDDLGGELLELRGKGQTS